MILRLKHRAACTIVASDESVAVFILQLSVDVLFSLFKRYVHVTVQTCQNPCQSVTKIRTDKLTCVKSVTLLSLNVHSNEAILHYILGQRCNNRDVTRVFDIT